MKSYTCQKNIVHTKNIDIAKKGMIDNNIIFKVSQLYKIFGDETRLKILNSLIETELCVCDISNILTMSHSSVSHQLKVLRDMNLVKTRKAGKSVYYSLSDEHILQIIKIGVEHVNEEFI